MYFEIMELAKYRKIRIMRLNFGGVQLIQLVKEGPQLIQQGEDPYEPIFVEIHIAGIVPLLIRAHVVHKPGMHRPAEECRRICALLQFIYR
ncbi:hypothetical protein D3C85_1518020 [compost metagenome]